MKVALANCYPFRAGEVVGPHASASTLLLVCLRGHGRVEVPGHTWQFSTGQAIRLPWECPIRYLAAAQEPFAVAGVHWSDQAGPPHRVIQPWPAAASVPGLDHLHRWDPEGHLQPLVMRLIAVLGMPPPQSHQRHAVVDALAAAIQAEWDLLEHIPDTGAASIGAIAAWLRLVLDRPVSRAEMAQRAGMAESTFAAAFRANYGMPPLRYLAELRLARAAELLVTTSLPVAEIARRCGFGDAPWFARAFARKYETSASVWRRSRRRI